MVKQDSKRGQIKLTEDEQIVWDSAVVTCSPHCLDIRETSQGCAHLLADFADELVRERRKRIRK